MMINKRESFVKSDVLLPVSMCIYVNRWVAVGLHVCEVVLL